jgi:hypothetical protein
VLLWEKSEDQNAEPKKRKLLCNTSHSLERKHYCERKFELVKRWDKWLIANGDHMEK